MKISARSILLCLALYLIAIHSAGGAPLKDGNSLVLFDFEEGFAIEGVEARDVEIDLVRGRTGRSLRVKSGHEIEWPGITLWPDVDRWDVSGHREMMMDVTNTGDSPVSVGFRIDNPGGDRSKNCVQVVEEFAPGEVRTIVAELSATPWLLSPPVEIVGMRGAPGQTAIDLANIIQLIVFVPKPSADHQFTIDAIRVAGEVEEFPSETFFPFIDEFGQFIHRDWPNKIRSEGDFAVRREAEEKELAAHLEPADRNRYGGWTGGSQLEATGFFRTQKYEGKWWLVDPEGRLFWSHGIDCVTLWNQTGTTDREHYFRGLPVEGSPLAAFYGRGTWAPHGYYKDKTPFAAFSHQNANLYRKYGAKRMEVYPEIIHRRLRSWGLNTIANWSSREIYLQRKTPYVATLHIGAAKLEGSEGYWGKFPDVFDPGFRASLRQLLSEREEESGDPWCIGFFVDNELAWGDEISLAQAALASPADQAAKKVFVADLEKKYGTVDQLNSAWGTQHASWEALLQSRDLPDAEKARGDLTAFYTQTAETYFKTISEELSTAAPDQLYLGCRFAWVNDRAVRAAIRFCDVVSFNKYTYGIEELALPDAADRPIIIGEFHFGALDRGMFHTGLKKARDQRHRAELYRDYVMGALGNPLIVGTHWFQYQDQSTTGRGDGENYQIGFVDICDTPYPEAIEASRMVGDDLYRHRLSR